MNLSVVHAPVLLPYCRGIPPGDRLCGLIERHPFTDPRPNPIANDRHHVAIVDDVGFVTDEAVAGHDHGATFLPDKRNRRDRDTDDAVEAVDHSLNASAFVAIDDGNRVWSKTSPVTSTSERRKKTMLSPSVCAAG